MALDVTGARLELTREQILGFRRLSIEPWRSLSKEAFEAIASEATSLPVPGISGSIRVRWGQ